VEKLISEAFAVLRLFEATRGCISHRPSQQHHRFLIEVADDFEFRKEGRFQEERSALLLDFWGGKALFIIHVY
jgi:hypothetical protein